MMSLANHRCHAVAGMDEDQLPSIVACVDSMRKGDLTPTELTEACLGKIDALDDTICAWVMVDRAGAREEAQRLTELARRGTFVGPLHGIPIGIKDIIDVQGMPTKAGSSLRRDASPAERDAPVVAALRRAGAIILGKTVTTEWACMDPPPTKNPWNVNRTPGGSSSGSAAAVASGMCMAALGTQTVGSIIRPAAYCGVCGLKPTFDAPTQNMDGIIPISFNLDHVGPIARSVADLETIYLAMTESSAPSFASNSAQPPVMCLLEQVYANHTSDEVREVFDAAIDRLRDADWIEANELPTTFSRLPECQRTIMAVDAGQVHNQDFRRLRESFSPKVAEVIGTGLSTSLTDYVEALRHKRSFSSQIVRTLLRTPTMLVMPSTPTSAPGPETTGDPRFIAPWSYCGLPALTIPCGFDREGLPVGMQIVAAPNHELDLLSVAKWCQSQLAEPDVPNPPTEI